MNSNQQMGVRGSLGWVLKVTGKAIFIIDQFPNVVESSFDGRWQGLGFKEAFVGLSQV